MTAQRSCVCNTPVRKVGAILSSKCLSCGVSRKVWGKAIWSWLYDWAPDDSILLFGSSGVVYELDLGSLETTRFLVEDTDGLSSLRFSHDGRWVAYQSYPKMESPAKAGT